MIEAILAGSALVAGGLLTMYIAGIGLVAWDRGIITDRLIHRTDIAVYLLGLLILIGGPAYVVGYALGVIR